jgi:hypothetical protein
LRPQLVCRVWSESGRLYEFFHISGRISLQRIILSTQAWPLISRVPREIGND